MKYFYVVLLCLLADHTLCDTIQSRLIGTEIADAADVDKNTVAFIDAGANILCTGSFIHASWILTSALCANKIDLNTRYLTSDKLAETYDKGNMLYNIIPHEQYNALSMINDIGLVQVIEPKAVKFNLIPKANKDLTDSQLIIRGLGLVGMVGTPADKKLRETTVTIKNTQQFCAKYGAMPANTVCSLFSLACLGDSGGPLLEGNNIWGIISMSNDDAEVCGKDVNHPKSRTTYTLVFPHRAWIRKTTGFNL